MAAAKAKAAAAATGQLHAVLGSDEYEVKRAARELAQSLTPPGGEEFCRDIIDGTVAYADDAVARIQDTIEALLTFPFFGGQKLVWLKNVSFLRDDQQGKAESVIAALEKLMKVLTEGLPASTRFLLSAIGADKRRSFYKGLIKVAKVQVFEEIDDSKAGWEDAAEQLAGTRARALGLTFSAEARELFALCTGGDRRVIENELEKLAIYLGPERKQVSAGDVRQLVPLSRAGIVFELGNAISERQLSRALDLLKQLLFQGEKPMSIMYAAVVPTVRHLLLAKDLVTRHRLKPGAPFQFQGQLDRLPTEAIAHLPRKKDGTISAYQLGFAAANVHRYEQAELRAALEVCLETNLQLVTSSLEDEIALSQMLVKIIAR